jgi:hypothetical protein
MFLISFFVHPETALWVDGRLFVSDIGEFNKRDGKVYVSPYVADVDRIRQQFSFWLDPRTFPQSS